MNRTTAIILTIVTALFCGLPGIGLICFAALGAYGTTLPDFQAQNPASAPQQALLGAGMFVCFGLLLLIIPVLVGIFTFRASKQADLAVNEVSYPGEPLPPAS